MRLVNNIPPPVIHLFERDKSKTYKEVTHLNLIKVYNGQESVLSNKINISKDRECAKSSPEYWLKIRQTKGNRKVWSSWVTGLFRVQENLYYGDMMANQKSLLIFHFSNEHKDQLRVYFFGDYYTDNINNIWPFLKKDYLKSIEGEGIRVQ